MKILLYNTWYFEWVDWTLSKYFFWKIQALFNKNHQEKITESFLQSIEWKSYDLCLLVEIKQKIFRYLDKNTKKKWYFDQKYHPHSLLRHVPFFSWNGNAIISSWEKDTSSSHFFRNKSDWWVFSAKKLYIEYSTEDNVKIVLLHLPLWKKARKQQLYELSKNYKNYSWPLIIAWDYNIFQWLEELDTLVSKLWLTILSPWKTFPTIKPHYALDLFLVRGIKNTECSIVKDIYNISDHLAIELEYTL